MIETAPGWAGVSRESKKTLRECSSPNLDRIGQVLLLIRSLITKSAGEPVSEISAPAVKSKESR